ncbi:flagellar basal body P-ring formation chaperone FlgA [Thioalkalivibrio sp. ALJ16]|uniref:flagellar basal body P-ring formation chaperone FlgA n=1 Tax=Thioalkalivibrio sp. ALJ16 TaxID=1158762 RepID=UPI0003600BB3|nr:flagellar basal body P-ring formation chaperone FlgA [Thioalkalivibrio sp. ALJ16]
MNAASLDQLATAPLAALGLCALLLLAAPAHAQIHPVADIRQAAERFLIEELDSDTAEDINIEIGQLDNRLRLAYCSDGLNARFPPGGRREGNTAVHLQCAGPVTWQLYVPATVERYAHVLVANRSLPRQHILTAGDLRFQRIETSRHAGSYHEDKSALVGQQTRRNIRSGQIIGTQHVTQREVVSRGQRVTILAENGSIAIRMQGEALENGTLGDRIRVKNTSSGRVVEGEIQASGHIRVAL